MTVAPVPQVDSPAFARAARRGLVILTLINLVNYVDRWIVPALVESLRKSDLHLTDEQAGLLMTGFLIVYTLASPIFGLLGDKHSRSRLVAAGVGLWSVATALGGFASGFFSLFVARATVGVGEAAYGTMSPALLADYYPKERRGRAFAIFFMAIPVGSALGYILGGFMDAKYGWRSAFFVAGIPGIILAILALRLFDPPRGIHDSTEQGTGAHAMNVHGRGGIHAFRPLMANRSYVLTVAGYAAYTFGLGGLATWMPAFLERVRHMKPQDATVEFGAIVVLTGIVGTFAGGWLGDRLLKRSKQAYFWLSGISTLLAAPCILVALTTSSDLVYKVTIIAGQLFMFASTGPINSAIVNIVPPKMRVAAAALAIFAMHLLGDVPSPWLIGKVSDATSLGQAVLIVPVAILIAGAIWTYAAWSGSRGDAGGRGTAPEALA